MATTFENELKKIFDDVDNLENKKYIGRAFYASIDNDLKFKAEFISTTTRDNYNALRFRIIHRDGNELDANTILLKDIWGMKPVPGNPNFPRGVAPYMWVYNGELEWYAYIPNRNDFAEITQQITDYVELFRDQSMDQAMGEMQM